MTSNVVCDYSDSVWELNSRGQNACIVYAQLQGLCDSNFVVNPVNANSTAYVPPNNLCGCNVVAYNLMAGCGWCQSTIQIPWWLTVDQWAGNCTAVPYNTVSTPPGINVASLTIPEWARALPTSTTWSPSQASRIAVAALSSASVLASSTGVNAPGSTTSRFFPSSGSGSSNGGMESARTAARGAFIAITIILVLYLLSGAAIVAVYFIRQKKRIAWYRPMAEFYKQQRGGGYGFNPAAPLIQNPNPSEYFTPQNVNGQYSQPPAPWAVSASGVSPSATPQGPTAPFSSTPSGPYPQSTVYAPPPLEHQPDSYSTVHGSGTGSASHSTGHGYPGGTGANSNPFTTPGASSSTTNVAVGGAAHTVAQYPHTQTPNYGYPSPAGRASAVGSSTGGTNTMSIYSTSTTTPYGGMAASVYGTPSNSTPHGPPAGPPGSQHPQPQYGNVNGSMGYSGRPEAY